MPAGPVEIQTDGLFSLHRPDMFKFCSKDGNTHVIHPFINHSLRQHYFRLNVQLNYLPCLHKVGKLRKLKSLEA